MKIKTNKIQCNNCKDIVESTHVHDFKQCSYGNVFTDGGKQYLRRGFKNSQDDYTDLSEYDRDAFIEQQIKEVRASMKVEGLVVDSETEELGRKILKKQITVDDAIEIIKKKYKQE